MKRITLLLITLLQMTIVKDLAAQASKNVSIKNISDLIIYDVEIINQTRLNLDSNESNELSNYQGMPINEYLKEIDNKYLNNYQLKALIDDLKNYVKSKKLNFFDGTCGATVSADQVLKSLQQPTDSVKLVNLDGEDSLDVKGNAVYKKLVSEDFYVLKKLKSLRFYEEWKMNKLNGMIEKSILGISYICAKEYNIAGERIERDEAVFGIAKDKVSLDKIKQFRSISSSCE
ncbi:MAG: hypothetical protein ACK452_14585 [Bacteroidota bacterium]|jgi:hypothetical protein